MDVPSRPPSTSPVDATHAGTWPWLLEVRQRIGPIIELLTDRLEPLLPPLQGEASSRLRQMIAARESALDALVRRAISSKRHEMATVGDLRVAALALEASVVDRASIVIIAEPVRTGADEVRRRELARLGERVSNTIYADRLSSASPGSVPGWRELSVLHRVLNQSVGGGSPREVVRLFVEALAIWSNIDAYAYVGDLAGRFTLDVALAGADPAARPEMLEADPILPGSSGVRLSAPDAERLGFRTQGDVLVTRVHGAKTAPWLIAHIGTFAARDEERLAVFSDVLLSSVEAAGEVEASRLLWALTQRLVGETSAHERAQAAAEELADLILASVSLAIRRADGGVTLQLGDVDAGNGSKGTRQLLTFPVPAPAGFSATLTVRRPGERAFTRREQRLAEVAASLLGSWASGLLQRGDLAGERRTPHVAFDELLDLEATRSATGHDREAASTGAERDASVLVIRTDVTGAPAELHHIWVGEIRRLLRPFDAAGTLTTGEIGVLLPNTSAQSAEAVVQRLRRSFQDHSALAPLESAPIGIASHGSSPFGSESLVAEARAQAAGVGRPQRPA
jgi:hypothetical protein